MKYKINDVEFEFDIYEVEDAKRLEEVYSKIEKGEAEAVTLLRDKKIGQGVEALYDCYKKFFIDLVGVDVIKDLNNALKAQRLVVDFVKGLDPSKEITSIND